MSLPDLSENSRRLLKVLRENGALSGYGLRGRLGLKDTQQLADSLNQLIGCGLVGDPGAVFAEDAILRAFYHIPPSMKGTVNFLLNQHPPKLAP
jgi:hypothetical protein